MNNNTPTTYICDPLWPSLETEALMERLNKAGITTVIISKKQKLQDIEELFEGDHDRFLCINPDFVDWTLTKSDYENIPHLKGIMVASTSHNWVETPEPELPLNNITNFSTESVAEWAILMMFSLARNIPSLARQNFPCDFNSDFMTYRGMSLVGKTAGIIGLGDIGKAVAKRCEGLGMRVIYNSRTQKDETPYEYKSYDDVLKEADVIFPTVTTTQETQELFTNDSLLQMKSSALFVNIAHDLVDDAFLSKRVFDKKLGGYGFESDPEVFNKYEGNVWATPPYAWATKETMQGSLEKLVDNIISASQNKFPFRVN